MRSFLITLMMSYLKRPLIFFSFLFLTITFIALAYYDRISIDHSIRMEPIKEHRSLFHGRNSSDSSMHHETLHQMMISFQDRLLDHGINAFIIEPCVLWESISESDKELLIKRSSVSKFAAECSTMENYGHPIMTFGIMESEANKMSDLYFKILLLKNGFEVEEIWDPFSGNISHHMIRKHRQIFHTVTFFRRNSFMMVRELTYPAFGISVQELRFGSTAQAFEVVTIEQHSIGGAPFLLPKERKRILFEMNYSKFLECRHDLAAKYEKDNQISNMTAARLKASIELIRKMVYNVTIPLWLSGGSLIGWARHCGTIEFDRDADISSWSHLNNNGYELTEELINSVDRPWRFFRLLGLPWMGYELKLWHDDLNWQMDLFFMTPDEEGNSSSYVGYHGSDYFYKIYYNSSSFFDICSAEVLGMKIMVPCLYEEALIPDYGSEWNVPDYNNTKFMKYQPRVHTTHWREEEAPYVLQDIDWNVSKILKFDYSKFKYDWNQRERAL